MIDPDVRAAIGAGTARVFVDLRIVAADPSVIERTQDGALALETQAPALTRLEAMRDIVARVRVDRVTLLHEDRSSHR